MALTVKQPADLRVLKVGVPNPVMVGGTLMGYLGAIHYWWPKMTGRMYPDTWARFAALVTRIGAPPLAGG